MANGVLFRRICSFSGYSSYPVRNYISWNPNLYTEWLGTVDRLSFGPENPPPPLTYRGASGRDMYSVNDLVMSCCLQAAWGDSTLTLKWFSVTFHLYKMTKINDSALLFNQHFLCLLESQPRVFIQQSLTTSGDIFLLDWEKKQIISPTLHEKLYNVFYCKHPIPQCWQRTEWY